MLLMTRRLLLLIVGTGLTSLINFWLYVVVAASDTSGQFAEFVKANYLGGLYLFGVSGSVGIVAMYAFRSGSTRAVLRQYFFLCTLISIPLMLGCLFTGNALGAILCLISALCMQTAGLMIAVLIEADRTVLVSLLPPMHPLLFWAALEWMPECLNMRWIWSYLFASVMLSSIFVAFGWSPLAASLCKQSITQGPSLKKVMARMLLATSFGTLLQLDVVFAGTLRHLDPARFAILQKMYASVSTALCSATLQTLLSKSSKGRSGAINVWMFSLAVTAAIGGGIVCIMLSWIKPSFDLIAADYVLISIASLLYFVSTYTNAVASIHWPKIAGLSLLVGALAYGGVIVLEIVVGKVWHQMFPIIIFFLTYITFAKLLVNKEKKVLSLANIQD